MSTTPGTPAAPTPLALKMVAVCLLLAVLWWGQPLLAPLCLAGLVALTLNPLVTRLSRWVPRSLAAALVGIVGGSAYSLSDEVAEAVEGLPSAARQLRQTLAITSIEGLVLAPLLFGYVVRIHPVAIFLHHVLELAVGSRWNLPRRSDPHDGQDDRGSAARCGAGF